MPSLSVPIPESIPVTSTLANTNLAKGGLLTEYGTYLGAVEPTVVQGGYPVRFDPSIMQVYAVSRIHLLLWVFIGEGEVETTPSIITLDETIQYGTLLEAEEIAAGKEGKPITKITRQQTTVNRPWTQTTESTETTHAAESRVVHTTVATTELRQVLPITVQVVAQLEGPEGIVWSQTFDVLVKWNGGAGSVGHLAGTGVLDGYADLVNPLTVYASQNYRLRLFVAVPTAAVTNTQLAITVEPEKPARGAPSAITFFYDPQPRYAGGPR